ncbi:hypothetical protein V0288_17905 [Pannus brasiliensis CCIBt3594]|uniref:Uncharacterized protein n=1 Tax=Pannus brasiliensis CCIBt3594 TaxID=1427578 RepID=A0AAW9QMI2_9CHRO
MSFLSARPAIDLLGRGGDRGVVFPVRFRVLRGFAVLVYVCSW